MRTRSNERDLFRVLRLLETLREMRVVVDVEAAVAARIRLLPIQRPWAPSVSLRQFGYGAAAAAVTIVFAAIGVLGALAPEGSASSGASIGASSGGTFLLSSLAALGRGCLREALDLAGKLSAAAPYLDGMLTLAAEASLLVCAAAFALAIAVAAHEARSRRSSA